MNSTSNGLLPSGQMRGLTSGVDDESDIRLAYTMIDDVDDRQALAGIHDLERYARPARIEASRRLRRPTDRLSSLLAGALVDFTASASFSGELPPIAVAEYGKPYFANNENLHFSLSHSGVAVACAVSRYPVGVDVEPIVSEYESIAALCLTEGEQALVESYSDYRNRKRAFTRIWTRKEAVGKCLGLGLSESVLCIDTLNWPRGFGNASFELWRHVGVMAPSSLVTLEIPAAYLSVCGRGAVHAVEIALQDVISASSTIGAKA